MAARGARPQKLLWASTGTKNPAYDDLKYVEPLIGPDTINTMSQETLTAYRDHGQPEVRLASHTAEEAAMTLKRLKTAGIDLDAVTQHLEDEVFQIAGWFAENIAAETIAATHLGKGVGLTTRHSRGLLLKVRG